MESSRPSSNVSPVTGAPTGTPVKPPRDFQTEISAHLERVSVAPAGDWVTAREANLDFKPKTSAQTTLFLMDRQYRAATHEAHVHSVQRLETIQAVQYSSQWRLNFDPATQRIVIHWLRVVRNGSWTEHAKAENFRMLQREENLENLIIDGNVTLMVLLKDVRVDDVLDISYTVQTSPRIFRERFSAFVTVPDGWPVGAFFLSVRFPKERTMQWLGGDTTCQSESRELGEETEWLWSLKDIEPAKPEGHIPAWLLPPHWFQISDCSSWAAVAAELAASWTEEANAPEILGLVEEIASTTADPAARIERAITHVQDDIRYLSMNVDLGGQIPSPPGTVLQRRFGDCKDKSFLLAHVLRGLGVSAHPVLVNGSLGRKVEELLPTPAVFNHCIVEYEHEGVRRWIDATMALQGGGALKRQVPDYGAGLPVMPVTEGLQYAPADQTADQLTLHETFLPDTRGDTSVLKVILTARGASADRYRYALANDGADAVAEARESFYRNLYPKAARVGVIQWRDNRETNEFVIGDTFEIPDVMIPTSNPQMVGFRYVAHLVQAWLPMDTSPKRTYPMDFSMPRKVEHRIELEFPNTVNFAVEAVQVRGDAFQFIREQKRGATVFTLKPSKPVILPKYYKAYRSDVEKVMQALVVDYWLSAGIPVSRQGRQPLIFSPGESQSRIKGMSPRESQPTEEGRKTVPASSIRPRGFGPGTAARPTFSGRPVDAPPRDKFTGKRLANLENVELREYTPPRRKRKTLRILLVIGLMMLGVAACLAAFVLLLRR